MDKLTRKEKMVFRNKYWNLEKHCQKYPRDTDAKKKIRTLRKFRYIY